MQLNEIMVKELRDEHRDREWIDKKGYRWAWCETEWLYWSEPNHYGWHAVWPQSFMKPTGEITLGTDGRRYESMEYDEEPWKNRGPYMEGLYYAATRGRR